MKPSEPWTEVGRYGYLIEVVEFKGRTYRRNPGSERYGARNYFVASGKHRLHRDIWEHHNGPIPDGHHVHHKDGNPLNNDPGNLELKSPADHAAVHGAERANSSEWKAHLQNIRPLARAGRKIVDATCIVCGKAFQAVLGRHPKFCSDACVQKDYRNRGKGLKEGTCEVCGKTYTCRKHLDQTTCSKACGFIKQSRTFQEKKKVREPIRKACVACGSGFDDTSHHRRRQYCTRACQHRYLRSLKKETS